MDVNIPYYQASNFYQADPFFQKIIHQLFPQQQLPWVKQYLNELGELSAKSIDSLVLESDHNPPILVQYDPLGQRIDQVQYHWSYQKIAQLIYEFGILGLGNSAEFQAHHRTYPPLLKFALGYLFSQTVSVMYCPICMTDGTFEIISKYGSESLKNQWLHRLHELDYTHFSSSGMYLTEAQGGSDVGANITLAYQENNQWKLKGEKWFCSNVGSDVALALARTEKSESGTAGLSLFLVPRKLENGQHNNIEIRRLKNKLGTREMATGEISFNGAQAYLIGDLKSGFKYMAEMINLSRMYNAIWSIGLIRRAYVEAEFYAHHRLAFGQAIINYPLVAQTLAKMRETSEKMTCWVFECISYYQKSIENTNSSETDRKKLQIVRLLIPVMKFYTAEQAICSAHQAIEILGGNGCIENFRVAKILRDSQILAIWEGSANILALDLLRVLRKTDAHQIFLASCDQQIDTQISNPQQAQYFKQRLKTLKDQFQSVLDGQDGHDGQLECRDLAVNIAQFHSTLVWQCYNPNS